VKAARLVHCLLCIVRLLAVNNYQTNYDGDNNLVSIRLELLGVTFLPRGHCIWLAASGFRFTTRKIEILGTNTDVYKATAYSWLLTGYCNKNYSR